MNNISELINQYDTYLVILTAMVTLTAAVVGQVVSHYLTNRRERQRLFMERYSGLYANCVLSSALYMNIRRNPWKLHDLKEDFNENNLLDDAINQIELNLKLGSMKLLKKFKVYKSNILMPLPYGRTETLDKISIIYQLYDDILSNDKNPLFTKKELRDLKLNRYYFGIALIAYKQGHEDRNVDVLLQLATFEKSKKVSHYKNISKKALNGSLKHQEKAIKKHLKFASTRQNYQEHIKFFTDHS